MPRANHHYAHAPSLCHTPPLSSVSNIMVPLLAGIFQDCAQFRVTVSNNDSILFGSLPQLHYISIELPGYVDTSSERTTLLYTTSLSYPDIMYQPIPNVHSGITPLQAEPGTEDISGWKTTRVIFPLENGVTTQGNIGFLGFHGSQVIPVDTLRLTPIGHEKAAVYLQPRLCHYLAPDPRTECPDRGELDGGVTRGVPPHGAMRMRGANPDRDGMLREEARAREKKLRGKFVW